MSDPENAGGKQAETQFKPGQSGNPAGKPRGTRHKITLAMEVLLDGEAESLTRKAIELALAGDMQALRLCMDRLAPPRKDRHVSFDMPTINTAEDAKHATASILAAVACGDLTPAEGAEVGKLIDNYIRAIEATEILERLDRLEGTKQ